VHLNSLFSVTFAFLVSVLFSSPRRNRLRKNTHSQDAGKSNWILESLDLRRSFVTVRLQPQMKKYRCPWYVSIQNHNILYFVHISGIRSLNTAIWLWKARWIVVQSGVTPLQRPENGRSAFLYRAQQYFTA
jgi:hypothetical protein